MIVLRYSGLILCICFLISCQEVSEPTAEVARIELVRSQDDTIQIVGRNLPKDAAATQFEIIVQSEASFTVTEAQSPHDLPFDSVQALQSGRNRARFFIGDKRGIRLRQDGLLASFRLLRTSSGDQNGRIRIESLKMADENGQLISVETGPSILIQ